MTTVYEIREANCNHLLLDDLFATRELAEQYIRRRYGRDAVTNYEVVPRTVSDACPEFRFDLRVFPSGSVSVYPCAPDADLRPWRAILFGWQRTPDEIITTCAANSYDDAYQMALDMRDAFLRGDTDVPVYQAGKRVGTTRYGQRIQSVFEVTLDDSGARGSG